MKKLLGIVVLGLLWCNYGNANDHPKENVQNTYKCVGKITKHPDNNQIGNKVTEYIGYEEFNNNLVLLMYDEESREFVMPLAVLIDLGSRSIKGKPNIKHTYVWYYALYIEELKNSLPPLIDQRILFFLSDGKIRFHSDTSVMKKSGYFSKKLEKITYKDNELPEQIEDLKKYTMEIHKHYIKKFKWSSPITLDQLFTKKQIAIRTEYECEEL
tara:strand:- start:65 stop:703 length:639 start_codon:yes stop_codon:yes gene_type:complete